MQSNLVLAATEGTSALELVEPSTLQLLDGGRKAPTAGTLHVEMVSSGAILGFDARSSRFPGVVRDCCRSSYDAASAAQRPLIKTRAEARPLFVACLLAIALVTALWGASSIGSLLRFERISSSVVEETVYVMGGDSLLAIAEAHPIDGLSASDTADWIRERNGLETGSLAVGQKLVVPQAAPGLS